MTITPVRPQGLHSGGEFGLVPFDAPADQLEALQNTIEQPNLPYRYDMPTGEMQYHVGKFLETADVGSGRFVGVRVGPNHPLANVGRRLECAIFDDEFGNGPQKMQSLYGGVEQDSTFDIVLDRHDYLPKGVFRVVSGQSAKAMTLAAAPDYIHKTTEQIESYHQIRDDEKVIDAATLGVAKELRGKMVGTVAVVAMLQRMFIRGALADGAERVTTMLDTKALRSLQAVGIPFEPMHGHTEPFEFEGSKATLAMIGNVGDFGPAVAKRHAELSNESFIRNVLTRGVKGALRRRVFAKIAGIAALGSGRADEQIIM